MMDFIVEYWYVIIAIIAVVAVAVYAILSFFKLPNDKQKAKIKEWLVWACIEAEKALQSGTGQLKLRQVWDMFCSVPAFSFVAKIITFETFSEWVSEALEQVKKMLVTNNNLAAYVYGENADEAVEKLKDQLGGYLSNTCRENGVD